MSTYYDGIRREAAAMGRAVREALQLPPAGKPGTDHCAVCRKVNCEHSDAQWSARA